MGVIARIRSRLGRGTLVVENTGDEVATGGGSAVSGYSGPPPKPGQSIVVKNTGSATATGDGDAVSGISYT
jgi:hypothetical protein